jgi:hypothetical protein
MLLISCLVHIVRTLTCLHSAPAAGAFSSEHVVDNANLMPLYVFVIQFPTTSVV